MKPDAGIFICRQRTIPDKYSTCGSEQEEKIKDEYLQQAVWCYNDERWSLKGSNFLLKSCKVCNIKCKGDKGKEGCSYNQQQSLKSKGKEWRAASLNQKRTC